MGPQQRGYRQQRIQDMSQVIRLPTSNIAPDSDELIRLETLARAEETEVEEVLLALRTLDSYTITQQHLETSTLSGTVKHLRSHPDSRVSLKATEIIHKWRQLIKREVDIMTRKRRKLSSQPTYN